MQLLCSQEVAHLRNTGNWIANPFVTHLSLLPHIYTPPRRFCGTIDARNIGLVTSVERIVEHVFMQALAYPNNEADDDELNCGAIKGQLLAGLRSFCSALRVCEEVCSYGNVFHDGKAFFLRDMVIADSDLPKNQEFCAELEERVSNWIKGFSKVLLESEQLRRENDSSGPQDELEYWKCRGAQFSQLMFFLAVRKETSQGELLDSTRVIHANDMTMIGMID